MTPVDKALLEKYIRGECSPEEERQVCCWLDERDIDDYPGIHSDRKYARKMDAGWKQLVGNFEDLGKATPVRRFTGVRRWRMAAAVLLLVMGSTFFYYSRWGYGGEKKYETSYGEVKSISLDDGTTVTLNARSILKIPKDFGRKHRDVQLLGEACFKVGPKAEQPFVVHTGKLSITALGTAFNVMAFSEEQEIAVSLTEGKVMVETDNIKGVTLDPGEEIVYTKDAGRMQRGTFNSRERLAWRKMIICFENADIHEVLNKLERFYGVHFDINRLKPRLWRLTGEYKNAVLQDVLESLSFNYDLKYRIENRTVILYEP